MSLADAGASVGLLDADIYGPNVPSLLGLDDATPTTTPDARIGPRKAHGVLVMNMDFVVQDDDTIIWRGPLVDDVIQQLTGDVDWGKLDYLIVDMLPGTGDAQLTLVQHLPVTGVVVVTTPQPVANDAARRGLEGFSRFDVQILGIVENMRYFECPDCAERHRIFGRGGVSKLAADFEIPVLSRWPIDPKFFTMGDGRDGPGVVLPILGRVGLPRTRREREARLAPIAIRDASDSRQVVRGTATRIAARVNAAAMADLGTEG